MIAPMPAKQPQGMYNVAMPCWTTKQPPHSLTIIGALDFVARIATTHERAQRPDMRIRTIIDYWRQPQGPLGIIRSLISGPYRWMRIARFVQQSQKKPATPMPAPSDPTASPATDPLLDQCW